MTEITVVKPVELEERILSKEEREVLYGELAVKLGIDIIYFEDFIRLEDDLLEKVALETVPDILILLIRQVLNYRNIIPIVNNAEKSDEYRISTQLIDTQRVVMRKDLEVYLNADVRKREEHIYKFTNTETINICGFVISEEQALSRYYVQDVINNMNIPGRLRSGNYNNEYLHTQMFGPYENYAHHKFFNNLGKLKVPGLETLELLQKSSTGLLYITFKNEDNVKSIGKILLQLCTYLNKYKLFDYTSIFLNMAQTEKKSKAKYSKLFNEISKILNFVISPDITRVPLEEYFPKELVTVKNFLLQHEEVLLGKLCFKYNGAVWFDLISMHLSVLLEKLIAAHKLLKLSDVTSKEMVKMYNADVLEIIEKLQHSLLVQAQISLRKKAIFASSLHEMKLRWIFINKFGYEKYEELLEKMPKYGIMRSKYVGTRGRIYKIISAKEREIIDIELKNLENYWLLTEKYKAPWKTILDNLRMTNNPNFKAKLFAELQTYLPKSYDKNAMIRNKEGYPIVCPHVIEKISLELAGESVDSVHEKIMKYAGEFPVYSNYYCEICGETLTYNEEYEGIVMFEGDKPVVFHNLDSSLKDFIWKTTNQIIRNYIKFAGLVTNKYINDFISNITNQLYETIDNIDKKLRKAKTNSLEDIENKKRLFTSIYIYAALIKVIRENPQKVSFADTKAGDNFDKMIKYATDKITNSLNTIINKIPDITEDFVNVSLHKAYQNLEGILGKAELKQVSDADLVSTLVLDPIYNTLVRMTVLHICYEFSGNIPVGRLQDVYKRSYDTKVIFGKPYSELIKGEYIYQSAIVPKFPAELIEPFNSFKFVNEIKDLSKVMLGHQIVSFYNFMDYVKSKIYDMPVFRVVDIVGIKVVVKMNDVFANFSKKSEAIDVIGDLVKLYKKKFYHYTHFPLPFVRNIQFLEKQVKEASYDLLAYRYGFKFNTGFKLFELGDVKKSNKFHKHKWNIYVFVKVKKFRGLGIKAYDDKDLIYFTGAETAKINFYKDHPEMFSSLLVDKICSLCYYNHADILEHIKDPQELLEQDRTLKNFYNYYNYRCPAAKPGAETINYHEFEGEAQKCKFCGLTKNMIVNQDLDYYYKYLPTFEKKMRTQSTESTKESKVDITFANKLTYPKIPEYITKWKISPNIVSEFVANTYNLFKSKYNKSEYYNIVNNLGLAEFYEYDKILNGSETPYKQFNDIERFTKLDIYIKSMIFDFYILKDYKNLSILPIGIKEIVNGLNSSESDKVVNMLDLYKIPGIGNVFGDTDYLEVIKYYKMARNTNLAGFGLEYLLRMVMSVLSYIGKNVGVKIAEAFITYFLERVIFMEKSTSKLKEAKAAIVEATQQISVGDEEVMQDHSQSRTYDELVKGETDKYTFSEVDYEGQNEDFGN